MQKKYAMTFFWKIITCIDTNLHHSTFIFLYIIFTLKLCLAEDEIRAHKIADSIQRVPAFFLFEYSTFDRTFSVNKCPYWKRFKSL